MRPSPDPTCNCLYTFVDGIDDFHLSSEFVEACYELRHHGHAEPVSRADLPAPDSVGFLFLRSEQIALQNLSHSLFPLRTPQAPVHGRWHLAREILVT